MSRVQGVNSKEKKRCAMTWRSECWGDPDMRAIRQSTKRAGEMEIDGSTVVDEGTKKAGNQRSVIVQPWYMHVSMRMTLG